MTRRLAWLVAVALAAWIVWLLSPVTEPAVEAPGSPSVEPSDPASTSLEERRVVIEPLQPSDAQREPAAQEPEHGIDPVTDGLRFLGRALEQPTGAPIADAEVLLFESDRWGSPWGIYDAAPVTRELARATTDAEGRFEVRSPSGQNTLLRVQAPGFVPAYAAVEPGHSEQELVLRVARSATLVGHVEREGRPVVGIDVQLFIKGGLVRAGKTAADGSCRIDEVPAGVRLAVTLVRAPPGAAPTHGVPPNLAQRMEQALPGALVLSPGETREATWQLGSVCDVHGIARDTNGRPMAKMWLHLRREDPGRPEKEPVLFSVGSESFPDLERTDDGGHFMLRGLPSGTWWLGPEPKDSRGHPSLDAVVSLAQRFVIREGMSDMDVELTVHPGLFIEGTVFAHDGTPAANVAIHSNDFDDWISTDASGNFRFGPLLDGEYEIWARAIGSSKSSPKVRAGAGDSGVELHF